MEGAATYALSRERNLIMGTLFVLAAAAWGLLIWQSTTAADDSMRMSPTMGWGALLFLAIWVVMMIAMMFPTAAPMILMFARVQASKRERGTVFVPTWVFVFGYLAIWTAFGVIAYFVAVAGEQLAGQSMWLMENAGRIGGILILLAGVYELSPLKRVCLKNCRTPLQFVLSSWRDGHRGAFRMGLAHGTYCLGCCWLLFVILFPLGIMNIAAMAVITLLIFAEKSLPAGQLVTRMAAAVMILYGAAVLFAPSLLPAMGTM